MLTRFVGIDEVKAAPGGLLMILVGTDFTSPHCDRQAYDVNTRGPVFRKEHMIFICNDAEADILHRRY